ncbi:MAG: ABC-2 transporter permease [Treponema sp.]|nr:ABC-2 transporter permease [Treponema sp.]
MKALLIKDIKTIQVFFYFIAIFGFFTTMTESVPYLSFVYVFMIPMTIMNQDELTHFSRLASMLPISVAESVLEKYVITLIGLGVAIVFSLLGIVVGNVWLGSASSIGTVILPVAVVLLYCAITLPLDFLVSSQIGRTIMMIVSMVLVGVVAGIFAAGFADQVGQMMTGGISLEISIGLIAVCAVLFALSIPLSIAIYKRKDR